MGLIQTGRISVTGLEGVWKEWHLIESRNMLTPKEANVCGAQPHMILIIAWVTIGEGRYGMSLSFLQHSLHLLASRPGG